MPPPSRVRRPLIALVVLVLLVVIGYTVKALRSDDGRHHRPERTTSQSS